MCRQLSNQDKMELVKILSKKNFASNEGSWMSILDLAGLSSLSIHIDFNGSALNKTQNVIRYLDHHGYVTYDRCALGVFLNVLLDLDYLNQQENDYVRKIIDQYQLMAPISNISYKGNSTVTGTEYEKILESVTMENTIKPVNFFSQAVELSRSVCYIANKNNAGTGFLIGKNIILTNNHVIKDNSLIEDYIFRFNYQLDINNLPEKHEDYRANSKGIFYTNVNLDYTIIELQGLTNNKWGYIPLKSNKINVGDRVNIIQHPAAMPKSICVQHNFVERIDNYYIQYLTSTMKGSSGSPVFDDQWNILALHHAGRILTENEGKKTPYYRNEGILISSILDDLTKQDIKIT